jgi:hypothetical protein
MREALPTVAAIGSVALAALSYGPLVAAPPDGLKGIPATKKRLETDDS